MNGLGWLYSIFSRVGAPAGASISADVAAIKAETALIVGDTNELQTDWTNAGRLDAILDELTTQGDTNETAIGTVDTVVDTNQDLLDGTTATPTAYRREYGYPQVKVVAVTANANAAADTTLGTGNTAAVTIDSIIVRAVAAQTGDLTSCPVYGGVGKVVTFIAAGNATQANLDATDKQVSWQGAVDIATGKTLVVEHNGTGVTPLNLSVTINYHANTDGGYLS